jgi:hypothetical protein
LFAPEIGLNSGDFGGREYSCGAGLAGILHLEAALICRPVFCKGACCKKGVSYDSYALACAQLEGDNERRRGRVRAINDPATLVTQGRKHEVEQLLSGSGD